MAFDLISCWMLAISRSNFASPECAASAISQGAAVAAEPPDALPDAFLNGQWQALNKINGVAVKMTQTSPRILVLSDKSLIP
ncbi:MAG TPA: hypothetical protein VI479_11345 [Blastocatellia bacterium]